LEDGKTNIHFRGGFTNQTSEIVIYSQCWDTKDNTPRNVSNNQLGPEAMTRVMLRVGHQQTWIFPAQIGGLPAKGFKQQNADFVEEELIGDW
jgi:chorismate mutase